MPGSELSALHMLTHSSLTAGRRWDLSHCTDEETEADDPAVVMTMLGGGRVRGNLNPGLYR